MKKILVVLGLSCLLLTVISSCKSSKDIHVTANELQRGTWQLDKRFGTETVEDDHMKGLPFIRFQKDNALSGSTGCNQFSGSYELKDMELKLERGPMTKMACPGEEEALFINALSKVVKVKLKDERLELMDESGTTLLEFVRAAE